MGIPEPPYPRFYFSSFLKLKTKITTNSIEFGNWVGKTHPHPVAMSIWTIPGIESNAAQKYFFFLHGLSPKKQKSTIKTVGKQSKHNPFLQPKRRNN